MRGGADGVGASQPQLIPATILRKNFEFIAAIKPHEVPNRPEFYMIGSGITEAFLNALTIGATCTHEDFRAPCFTNEEIAAAKMQLNAEQVAFDALSVEEQAAHTAEGGLPEIRRRRRGGELLRVREEHGRCASSTDGLRVPPVRVRCGTLLRRRIVRSRLRNVLGHR